MNIDVLNHLSFDEFLNQPSDTPVKCIDSWKEKVDHWEKNVTYLTTEKIN